jgi:hypothetical protein
MKEGVLGRACSTHGGGRSPYTILVGKSEKNRLLSKSRSGWKNSVNFVLKK